jgi:hypothetical protein
MLRFLLPVLILPNAPHSSVTRDWYSRPTSGGVASGLGHTPPHGLKNLRTNYISQYNDWLRAG